MVPPEFDSVTAERLHRKRELAAAFRLFGKFGFSEGVNNTEESRRIGATAAGDPQRIDRETAPQVREQIGTPLPGGFQLPPLWGQITAEQPDLFE